MGWVVESGTPLNKSQSSQRATLTVVNLKKNKIKEEGGKGGKGKKERTERRNEKRK